MTTASSLFPLQACWRKGNYICMWCCLLVMRLHGRCADITLADRRDGKITDEFCRVTQHKVWKQRRQKRMTWASWCENVFPDHECTISQSVLNGFQRFALLRHSRGCIITSIGQTGIFWIHLHSLTVWSAEALSVQLCALLLLFVLLFNNILPPFTLFSFNPSFLTYFPLWEKSHSRKRSVSAEIWPESFYIYLFSLIWWERRSDCNLSQFVWEAQGVSAVPQQETRAPLLISQACFPGLSPPPPAPPPPPPPYYYGTMWTMAFNLLFSPSLLSSLLSLSPSTWLLDFFTSQSSSLGGLSPHWVWHEVWGCCAVHQAVSTLHTLYFK